MISKQLCEAIWKCHREIENGENLIAEIEKKMSEPFRKDPVKLPDAFGHGRDLELGIPSGPNSTRMYGLSYDLALPVIRAHVANMKEKLVEYNERARLEIDAPQGDV